MELKTLLIQLSMVLMIYCLATVAAVCSKEGELHTEQELYDDILSADFARGAVVDFEYQVTYSTQDSYDNPIQLVLYIQQNKPTWNKTTTCEQKIESEEKSDAINQVISLSPTNYWSGCSRIGDEMKCQGGRSFGNAQMSTFIIAVARCKSHNIQMKYKFAFNGYEKGSCIEDGEPVTPTTPPRTSGLSTEFLVVLIITVFNTTVIILAIVYAICRKYRLSARGSGQTISMNNMLFDRDNY